jgi:hypothetical protein
MKATGHRFGSSICARIRSTDGGFGCGGAADLTVVAALA